MGESVDVKRKLLGFITNWSYGSMKINSEGKLLSSRMRFCRGEPTLPKVLYSPLNPVVKMVFIYIYDKVSSTAGVLSPKCSSIVHALMPRGISLFLLSIESEAFCFLPF